MAAMNDEEDEDDEVLPPLWPNADEEGERSACEREYDLEAPKRQKASQKRQSLGIDEAENILLKQYNQQKNQDQWNYNKGFIDINYLIWVLNKNGTKLEYVNRFKPYTPITRDISDIKQINFNKPFVSEGLDYNTFEHYEAIIIKSCTGTGKTTAVAKHAKQYMKPETKFLSITTRTSLSDQHQTSFEELGMKNYQDVRANMHDVDSLTICLNS